MVNYSNAQRTLDFCGDVTINDNTFVEQRIGNDLTEITITVRGGDGGSINVSGGGSCSPKIAKGGSAATMVAKFPIGSNSDYLQPGGILRTFIGSAAQDNNQECGNINVFAGGGGSTAVLYLPPGRAENGPYWRILMVAGGGGGAGHVFDNVVHDGLGANTTEKGDDVGDANAGINGGCSDSHTSIGVPGYAGGSAFCSDYDGNVGSSMIAFYPSGGPITFNDGYVIKQPKKIDFTRGDGPGLVDGGIGFTGGGQGSTGLLGGGGGGGGGGYSGGAASTYDGGGGGGSYITGSFNAIIISKTAGTDGGSMYQHGYAILSPTTNNSGTCGEFSPTCGEEIKFVNSAIGDDMIIPAWANSIDVEVKGGDGGHGIADGVFTLKGGEGATIVATLAVGNSDDHLRPGGRLRYVVGGRGRNDRDDPGKKAGGSGGGSSTLLYFPPGGGPLDWKVLMIAGGGGGGSVGLLLAGDEGEGGRSSESGGGWGGSSPSDPCSLGYFTGFLPPKLTGAAGGSYGCTNTSYNSPTGRSAGLGNVTGAPLTGGNSQDYVLPDGGFGYQGGGASLGEIGGGGGGYYGGGAKGGGGSFFNTSFSNTGLQKIEGAKGGSSRATGYVKLKFNGVSAPNAACKNTTVHLDSNGNGSIGTSDIDNGSTGPCGSFNLALSKTAFTCSELGSNTVTLTATDNGGNSSSCTASVIVEDKVTPTTICQNVTVQLNASGNGSTSAGAVNNNSSDACGIANLSLSKTSFDCSNVGANAVTLTVTDNNSNSSTCSATVMVTDPVAPIAVCQNVTVQLDANGDGSTSATAINNGSNDACGIANLNLSQTTFNCSNVGANTVTLTVTDVNGNSGTCTATVTVEDNVAPTAICQDVTIQLDADGNGTAYTEAINNGSSDACGIDGYALSQTSFDCSHVGANTVTLSVTDIHGNVGTCNATVTVEDLVAPVISSELIFLGCSMEVNYDQYEVAGSATDNCGVDGDSYVIAVPAMTSPTMEFKMKNNKKLHFLFNQNKIIVNAPGAGGAEAWWNEIEGQGGVAVSLGQEIDLSGVEGSNSINFLFDNNGDLKNVTAFSMTMVHNVTDLSGNPSSESYTVSRQCGAENRSSSPPVAGNDLDIAWKDKSVVREVEVFPNPFSNQTSIQYELSASTEVIIDVMDLRGVRVARLLQADQDAGFHRINWDGSMREGGSAVPGMYIIQLRIGAEILNKKVIQE